MNFLIGSLLVLASFICQGQLVNDLQRDDKRMSIINAYEDKTVVKMLESRYAVLDVKYFYIDSSRIAPDGGGLSHYKWADEVGFLVPKDSANLSDVKVKNLKTGKTAIIRYFEIYKYHDVKFTKKKHKT